jgi:hypothetical protein
MDARADSSSCRESRDATGKADDLDLLHWFSSSACEFHAGYERGDDASG